MEQLGGQLAAVIEAPEQDERAIYRFEHDDGRVVVSYDPESICPYIAVLPEAAREMVKENARVKDPEEIAELKRVMEEEARTEIAKAEPAKAAVTAEKILPKDRPVVAREQREKPAEPVAETVATVLTAPDVIQRQVEAVDDSMRSSQEIISAVEVGQNNILSVKKEATGLHGDTSVEVLKEHPVIAEPVAVEPAVFIPRIEAATEPASEVTATWNIDDAPVTAETLYAPAAETFLPPIDPAFVAEVEVPTYFAQNIELPEPGIFVPDETEQEASADKTVPAHEVTTAQPQNNELDALAQELLPEPVAAEGFVEMLDDPEPTAPITQQISAQIEQLATDETQAAAYEESKAILDMILQEIEQEFDPEITNLYEIDTQESQDRLESYVERLLVCLKLPADKEMVKKVLNILKIEAQQRHEQKTQWATADETAGTHEDKLFDESWVTNILKNAPGHNALGRAVVHLTSPLLAAA